jgi:hypothetical protein
MCCCTAGFQFCFVRKPHLTFDIALKGVLFSEVPGLVSELKRRLLAVIVAEAVEPARVWVNLQTPFYNLVTRKQTGRQGQLKVRVKVAHPGGPYQAFYVAFGWGVRARLCHCCCAVRQAVGL